MCVSYALTLFSLHSRLTHSAHTGFRTHCRRAIKDLLLEWQGFSKQYRRLDPEELEMIVSQPFNPTDVNVRRNALTDHQQIMSICSSLEVSPIEVLEEAMESRDRTRSVLQNLWILGRSIKMDGFHLIKFGYTLARQISITSPPRKLLLRLSGMSNQSVLFDQMKVILEGWKDRFGGLDEVLDALSSTFRETSKRKKAEKIEIQKGMSK